MYLGRLIIALILLLSAIILIPIIYCSQDLILIIILKLFLPFCSNLCHPLKPRQRIQLPGFDLKFKSF